MTLLALLGLGGATLIVGGDAIKDTVTDVLSRGSKLSYGTFDPVTGIVVEQPEALRAAASSRYGRDIPMDVYALARMIRSEGAAAGRVRAHVALNDLKDLGWSSLFYLLTYSTDVTRRGWFGAQYSPPVPPKYPHANGRRYATSKEPYTSDVNLAFAVLNEEDPTGGAVKFLDRSSLAVQVGAKSFDAVNASWTNDGLTPYTLPTFGDDLVLYRRA